MSRSARPVIRSAPQRIGLVLLLALACWSVATSWAPRADAHAVLVSSDPTSNTVLTDAPLAITLTFDEPVQAVRHAIRLFAPNGDEITPVSIASRDAVVTATLDPLIAPGSYTVAWEVVSADGHDVKGGYVFHLRTRTASAPRALDDAPPRAALGLRALGTALTMGALVSVVAMGARRRAWAVATLGALAAGAGAVGAVGGSLGEGLDLLAANTTGLLLAVTLALTVLGLALATTPLARPLAAFGILGASLPGHAIALDPVWRSASLSIVHVAAAGLWATGLLWLSTGRHRSEPAATVRAVQRVSPWAMADVTVLAATGAILLLTRTGWSGLASGYGVLGLVKVALLLVALALAARNRWVLTPALAATELDDDAAGIATRRLHGTIRLEVIVLAMALLVGTVLGQVAPPQHGSVRGPFLQRAAFGADQVELLVDPARVGANDVHVSALHADGTLDTAMLDLAVELRLPARDIGPLAPTIATNASGHLIASANLTLPGTWTVRVTGHLGTFDQLIATFEVPVT